MNPTSLTDHEANRDGVNGDDRLPGKVLQCPSEESLGEEEPTDQNTEGIPWLIQFFRNSICCNKSFTQDAKGFSNG